MKNIELKNVTIEQIREFWGSLTVELESYGTDKVSDLLYDGLYIEGFWRDGKLVSLGGAVGLVWGLIVVPVQIVHRDYQGMGLSHLNSKACIDYARRHHRSMIISPINNDNPAIQQSQITDGFVNIFNYKHQIWMGKPLTKRGIFYQQFVPACVYLYYSPVLWPLRLVRRLLKQRV